MTQVDLERVRRVAGGVKDPEVRTSIADLGLLLTYWDVLGGSDCRPAFRSRYVHHVQPWELIEYDEDGEAIVRGLLPGDETAKEEALPPPRPKQENET